MTNSFLDRIGAAEERELLTGSEAAAILGLTEGTLAVWRSTGRYGLPFIKAGGKVRYRKSDLDAWLAKRTHHATPAKAAA